MSKNYKKLKKEKDVNGKEFKYYFNYISEDGTIDKIYIDNKFVKYGIEDIYLLDKYKDQILVADNGNYYIIDGNEKKNICRSFFNIHNAKILPNNKIFLHIKHFFYKEGYPPIWGDADDYHVYDLDEYSTCVKENHDRFKQVYVGEEYDNYHHKKYSRSEIRFSDFY